MAAATLAAHGIAAAWWEAVMDQGSPLVIGAWRWGCLLMLGRHDWPAAHNDGDDGWIEPVRVAYTASVLPARIKQNPCNVCYRGSACKILAMTYSRMGNATLPSAQLRFTAEFGMESGGSTTLWSPETGSDALHPNTGK